MVFYSDGVIEAENEAGKMIDLIVSNVTAYVGDEEASDDITIFALRCEK